MLNIRDSVTIIIYYMDQFFDKHYKFIYTYIIYIYTFGRSIKYKIKKNTL